MSASAFSQNDRPTVEKPKAKGRRPRDRSVPRAFTPLSQEVRTHITTEEAAHHLSLAPQTMRAHACKETWLIRPVRIPGRLGLLWPVADIKRALGLAS